MCRLSLKVAGLSLLLLLLVAGSGTLGRFSVSAESAPAAAQVNAEVNIDNFTFQPQTLTVKAGTMITWTNRDDIPHTVTSSDALFKSKTLDTDDKFTFTPTKPGTYSYFCSIHPKMTGKVVVE